MKQNFAKFTGVVCLLLLTSFVHAQINRELVNLIETGNNPKAKQLIDKESNLTVADTAGYTYLHYTALFNNQEVADYLLQKGVNVDITNNKGTTPLLMALLNKNKNIAHFFVEKGANVNYIRPDGGVALLFAIQSNMYETTKWLIEKHGADVNYIEPSSNVSTIGMAVANADYRIVKLLIENGANCNVPSNINGMTPLMLAAYYGKFKEVKLILLTNPEAANTFAPKWGTAKDLAIASEEFKIAEFIIEPKFNVFDIIDLELFPALIDSLKKDRNIALRKDSEGYTLLHKAIYNLSNELLVQLVENNCDINLTDTLGRSPLLYAIHIGNNEAAQYLIEKGADINLSDYQNYSPYILAELKDNKPIANILKEKGANTGKIRYLLALSNPVQHTDVINSINFSSNNLFAVTSSEDEKIILWDIATWNEVRTFSGHTQAVNSAVFSTDNKMVLSTSDDGTLKLWDIETGNLIRTYEGHFEDVIAAYFTNNNKYIVSASLDDIIVWELSTGQILNKFSGHSDWIRTLTISSDERFAATGSDDKSIIIWDLQTGEQLFRFNELYSEVYSICFSPDNKFIFGGSENGKIGKWSLETGNFITSINAHTSRINELILSPDKLVMLSVSDDHTARFWNMTNLQQTQKELKGFAAMQNAAFLTNGNSVMTTSFYNMLLWDRLSSTYTLNLDFKSNGSITGIQFLNNSNTFYANGQGGVVKWDLEKLQLGNNHLNNTEIVRRMQIANEKIFIDVSYLHPETYNTVHEIRVINLNTNELERKIDIEIEDMNEVFYSVSGNTAVHTTGEPQVSYETMTYISDNSLQLIDLNTGKKLKKLKPHKNVGAISFACFSDNEKLLATTGSDSTISIWEISSGKEKVINAQNEVFMVIKFDNSQNYLIAGSVNGEIELFDVAAQKSIRKIQGHSYGIWDICFSSDGKLMATASSDNSVKIWSFPDLKLLHTFTGHTAWVRSVCFSPDNNLVLSGSMDNTIKIWSLASSELLASLYTISKSEYIPVYENNTLKDFEYVETYEYAAILPDGYYSASKGAVQSLGFKYGTRAYSFEQFDLIYNSPHKILQAIGYSADSTAYRLAYEKRFERIMGTSPHTVDVLDFPELAILNKSSFEFISAEQTVELKIQAHSKNQLQSFNIWVNNVPIYGIEGLPISGYDLNNSYQIELSNGLNKIQIAVKDINGLESLKERIDMVFKPENIEKPNLYILGIGVSQFENQQMNLTGPDKNITDFVEMYKQQEGKLYNKVFVETLVNAAVSKNDILEKAQFLKNAGVNDLVIVFYSGHGEFNKEDTDYFLKTYQSDINNIELNDIAYDDLYDILDNIKPRNKLFLVDACYSGEKDSDKNSFMNMRKLFFDLQPTNGSIVISSATGFQAALAGKEGYTNFGFLLMKAIKEKKADTDYNMYIQLDELLDYLVYGSSEYFEGSANSRQQPTIRNENIKADYTIWY